MCSWSVLVMFSRLYLGVHSPADIVSGKFSNFSQALLITSVFYTSRAGDWAQAAFRQVRPSKDQTVAVLTRPTTSATCRGLDRVWKLSLGGILGSILLSLFLQVDDQIDLFISQRGFESILYYLIFVVFLLSIFPSTDVSNPVSFSALGPSFTL